MFFLRKLDINKKAIGTLIPMDTEAEALFQSGELINSGECVSIDIYEGASTTSKKLSSQVTKNPE